MRSPELHLETAVKRWHPETLGFKVHVHGQPHGEHQTVQVVKSEGNTLKGDARCEQLLAQTLNVGHGSVGELVALAGVPAGGEKLLLGRR